VIACLCVWLVVVGSMSGPDSPLCRFKTAAKWDMEALKQITRTLLDTDAVDVLAAGLKIFISVSWFSVTESSSDYCCVMLCISLALAIVRCLSVCPSNCLSIHPSVTFVYSVETNKQAE